MRAMRGTPRLFRLKPPKRPRLLEKHVVRACLDLLHYRGYWTARLHAGRVRMPNGNWIKLADKGTPDYAALHATYPGFLLEFKRPGSGPTPDQVCKHEEIRVGYRLAICVIDDVSALPPWLALHEAEPDKLTNTS